MEQVSYTCKTLRQKVYEYIQKNSYENIDLGKNILKKILFLMDGLNLITF